MPRPRTDLRLWEPVAERFAAEGVRSYAPSLPLGAHQSPMNPGADLSPEGIACLEPGLRSAMVRPGPLAFGPLSSAPLDAELTRDWVRPLASKAIRHDLAKFARGVHPRVLLDAAGRFSWTKPL